MKKQIFLYLFIAIAVNTFSQTVIINGSTGNRLLTWDDFTGKPDKSSSYQANTYWKTNYSYKGVTFNGDTAKFSNLLFRLELDKDKSWVKSGKETDALLKHEQGHFDIGLLCLAELTTTFNNTIFLKPGFQTKVKSIFTTVMEKYHLMGITYDTETDHSKNKEAQKKWNDFFDKELRQ